jgi:hypothetical protein
MAHLYACGVTWILAGEGNFRMFFQIRFCSNGTQDKSCLYRPDVLSRKCDIFEINPPSDSGLSGFLADNRQQTASVATHDAMAIR